jgi:hypothetical protein
VDPTLPACFQLYVYQQAGTSLRALQYKEGATPYGVLLHLNANPTDEISRLDVTFPRERPLAKHARTYQLISCMRAQYPVDLYQLQLTSRSRRTRKRPTQSSNQHLPDSREYGQLSEQSLLLSVSSQNITGPETCHYLPQNSRPAQ